MGNRGETGMKRIFGYIVSAVIGMLGLSLYILADTYFIATGIGADGLTALNLAIPVYSFLHGTGLLIGMGAATHYAIARIRKDVSRGNRVFTAGILWVTAAAIVYVLTGLFGVESLMRLFGAEGAVLSDAVSYLKIILLSSPFFLANNLLLCFVRNDGKPKRSMAAMLGGSLVNIVLDWIFIFPCQMGMSGAALATCIAPVVSLGVLSCHFLKRENGFRPEKGGISFRVLAPGIPSLVNEVSNGIVMIAFNTVLLGMAGNRGVAAYGVIANIALVVTAVYTGIGQGLQPLFSEAYATGNREYSRKVVRSAGISVLAVSVLVWGCIFPGAEGIAKAFEKADDPLFRKMAADGMRIYFSGCLLTGVNIVASICFSARERIVEGQTAALLRGLVLILPAVWILSGAFGADGVWMSVPVTEALTLSVVIAFVMRNRRKDRNEEKGRGRGR